MTPEAREAAYRKLVRKQKIGAFFAPAIMKRRRSLTDKLKLMLMKAMMPKPKPRKGPDIMADDLCAAEPEFTVEELRAFHQSGNSRLS